ncbi:hypothetical protein AAGG74_18935 [Bacillus mexicanus]|uniref:hypothetical protein n=1 Tax=Bacillus mexicanus TaxID=2834415 RepID=UPI003D1FAB50
MTKPGYQVFENEEKLREYIIKIDPMKSFTPSKREIAWNPADRICRECNNSFKPKKPAQLYCSDCQNKEERKNKRKGGLKANPTPSKCADCGHDFYKTAPAMRKCEICSKKGGKRISKAD